MLFGRIGYKKDFVFLGIFSFQTVFVAYGREIEDCVMCGL